MRRYLLYFAAISALYAVFARYMAAQAPVYVDASGFLHEPFAWIASGSVSAVVALAALAIAMVSTLFTQFKKH